MAEGNRLIHYHGGPITPTPVGIAVWKSRHAMISYARADQIKLAAEICQSFALDNGAFSVWTKGEPLDIDGYAEFVGKWMYHPGFDWALIPDVIDGNSADNDELIRDFRPAGGHKYWQVPVWHLHEPLDRLERLAYEWPRVAIGSSGEYSDPGSPRWWSRISEAMEAVCDKQGRPKAKLHGLRMLDPTIFSHIPFASADSSSVARNASFDQKWGGPYEPLTQDTRGLVLVDRIEAHASANRWCGSCGVQKNFELVG